MKGSYNIEKGGYWIGRSREQGKQEHECKLAMAVITAIDYIFMFVFSIYSHAYSRVKL